MLKATDLATRDVINVIDGRRLGPLKDIEIDNQTGAVQAIVLRSREKFLRFFPRGKDVVVPWKYIKKIGVDAILVEMPSSEISC